MWDTSGQVIWSGRAKRLHNRSRAGECDEDCLGTRMHGLVCLHPCTPREGPGAWRSAMEQREAVAQRCCWRCRRGWKGCTELRPSGRSDLWTWSWVGHDPSPGMASMGAGRDWLHPHYRCQQQASSRKQSPVIAEGCGPRQADQSCSLETVKSSRKDIALPVGWPWRRQGVTVGTCSSFTFHAP